MAKPLIELIQDEIVSRLNNITDANGYEFDRLSVEVLDRDLDDWPTDPLAIVVEFPETAPNDEFSCAGNPPGVAYDATFGIYGYASQLDVDDSEVGVTDTGVTDQQMIAALERAVTNKGATGWETFGNNAHNAKIVNHATFDAPGHNGGMIVLEVLYRHNEGDPFTKR